MVWRGMGRLIGRREARAATREVRERRMNLVVSAGECQDGEYKKLA